jgi:hypothetical protein
MAESSNGRVSLYMVDSEAQTVRGSRIIRRKHDAPTLFSQDR